ncbi:aminotransferase class V-fold PLP-dependent enzyme [Brumimicrobium aurantiacum]|uniref:Cysteine desulfurase n=1 Tax=Brumimicrobium aurantiacum TaxID=1737063 RepID=A0A3E1EVN2_9FLAO|nr:cysteine desulfurase [Brumimicrobium aurantiacum]RFC53588.1 cysteine desulfurase [Brumimicrobium aurantiacum]
MNIQEIRSQFPILSEKIHGKPLVYFDNGATTQKPSSVIQRINDYYAKENANIHRGVHTLSQEATSAYENARTTIQQYLGAKESHEILFTKGTTDSINLVAFSFGELLTAEDEIIISAMEHHSNIVPWQMLCERKGCKLRIIPMNENGELALDQFETILSAKTKLVAVTHISNALGTVNDVKHIIDKAHKVGAKVLIDGAQSIQHIQVNVQELDCDFYAFSGHKLFGPTGIGVLYGKEEILNSMPPYQGGGDMIKEVTLEKTTYNELPHKFEAGTPNIAGGIGLGAAFEFLNSLDMEAVLQHEQELLDYATEALSKIEGIQFYGRAKNKTSVISFLIEGTHPYDVGTLLDKMGIAVRTGHHCTQPIMDQFCIPGTIRASFAFYNTKEEIDIFIKALERIIPMLKD